MGRSQFNNSVGGVVERDSIISKLQEQLLKDMQKDTLHFLSGDLSQCDRLNMYLVFLFCRKEILYKKKLVS